MFFFSIPLSLVMLAIIVFDFVVDGQHRWAYASLAACHLCYVMFDVMLLFDLANKLSLSLSLCMS